MGEFVEFVVNLFGTIFCFFGGLALMAGLTSWALSAAMGRLYRKSSEAWWCAAYIMMKQEKREEAKRAIRVALNMEARDG